MAQLSRILSTGYIRFILIYDQEDFRRYQDCATQAISYEPFNITALQSKAWAGIFSNVTGKMVGNVSSAMQFRGTWPYDDCTSFKLYAYIHITNRSTRGPTVPTYITEVMVACWRGTIQLHSMCQLQVIIDPWRNYSGPPDAYKERLNSGVIIARCRNLTINALVQGGVKLHVQAWLVFWLTHGRQTPTI